MPRPNPPCPCPWLPPPKLSEFGKSPEKGPPDPPKPPPGLPNPIGLPKFPCGPPNCGPAVVRVMTVPIRRIQKI